jgi:hypothetical protein
VDVVVAKGASAEDGRVLDNLEGIDRDAEVVVDELLEARDGKVVGADVEDILEAHHRHNIQDEHSLGRLWLLQERCGAGLCASVVHGFTGQCTDAEMRKGLGWCRGM